MVQILTTDDSNGGQLASVPVPGRSSPLVIQPVPASSIVTAAPPLSSALFVDPGTTVPLASQDGSIAAPFATLQQAVDAAGDLFTILVCHTTTGATAGDAAWDDKRLTFIGLGTGNQDFAPVPIGTLTFDSTGPQPLAILQNVNCVSITDLSGIGAVSLLDASCGPITCDAIGAVNSHVPGDIVGNGTFRNCTVGFASTWTGDFELDRQTFNRTFTSDFTLVGTITLTDAWGAGSYHATGANTILTSGGTWVAPSTANFGEESALPQFALTAAACLLTYSAAPFIGTATTREFLVRLTAVINADFAGQNGIGVAIDHNGDTIGTLFAANPFQPGKTIVNHVPGIAGAFTQIVASERVVTLADGETLQPAFGTSAGVDMALEQVQLTVQPVR